MEPGSDSTLDRLIERLRESVPDGDQRAQNALAALRSELQKQEEGRQSLLKELAAYEEAYEKLTAPANRLGVYLRELGKDTALIALGDTEYVATIDPQLKRDCLEPGRRVMLNDAYAIVGDMEPADGGALVKVSESLDDGRLRIATDPQGQTGRLVERGKSLKEAKIEAGDEVRLEGSGRVAIELFQRGENRDFFVEEIPETPWSQVGGQEEAIQAIKETVEQPMLHPEVYERFQRQPAKGVLLYGPPGCGKTLIGKAVAYNLAQQYSEHKGEQVSEYFMHVSGPKILNMWLGESERLVREMFSTAREKAKEGRLVVLFLDEAESILRTRSGGRWLNISNTVVPQFCAEMDGLSEMRNVVVIVTSNRPDYIDPAVLRPGRIDRKIRVARPGLEQSKQVLAIHLDEAIPLDPELIEKWDNEPSCARKAILEAATAFLFREADETKYVKVTRRSGVSETLHWKDFVSGALLKSAVDRAKSAAIRRSIESGSEHGISVEDMEQAIRDEYRESEIFPKSDATEDWLKLLDFEPEQIVGVRPIRPEKGSDFVRRSVV